MRDGSVVTLLLCYPVLSPMDGKSLNFLVQPRNGLGLSHHGVEKLAVLELASRAGHQGRGLLEPSPLGMQVGRAAGKLASRNLWGLTSRWGS